MYMSAIRITWDRTQKRWTAACYRRCKFNWKRNICDVCYYTIWEWKTPGIGLNLAWYGMAMESLCARSDEKILCERQAIQMKWERFYKQRRPNVCVCVYARVCTWRSRLWCVWDRSSEFVYALLQHLQPKQSFEFNQKVCHDQINGK